MQLVNFHLESPSMTITLLGLDVAWDLHNWADFRGFTYNATQRSVILEWTVREVENPWGSANNHFRGCALRFQNVSVLVVSPRRTDAATDDDTCLSGVSKVLPEAGDFRHLIDWPPEQAFHLLFEFMSGQTIEIGAERAELLPRDDAT